MTDNQIFSSERRLQPVNTSELAPNFNSLAIVGFVLAFAYSLGGLVLCFIALVQIRRRGGRGKALAVAGVIVSIVLLIVSVVASIAVFSAMLPLVNA